MFPHKDGYDFIAVNFGGWHLCQTLEEVKKVAANMQPEPGIIYTRGFFSTRLNMVVGKDQWFPLDKA